jgi:hypothetical protein
MTTLNPSVVLRVVLLALAGGVAHGFAPHHRCSVSVSSSSAAAAVASSSSLAMVPRFDPKEQKWFPSSEEESSSANYPSIRSLLRHGPKAYFVRVTQPDMYDQAVLKFMASDKVGRWEAQGNMDRFNENAQDWIFERLEAKRKGTALDYVTLDRKQVVLSSVWAGVVFWFANDLFQRYVMN